MQATSEVQQRFGLADTEELVEEVPCTLVQAGSCSHNSFTPHLPVRPLFQQEVSLSTLFATPCGRALCASALSLLSSRVHAYLHRGFAGCTNMLTL